MATEAPSKKAPPGQQPTAAAAAEVDDGWMTVSRDDAPPWALENVFITHGYRPKLTWTQAARSIFRWHNQTLNVWTHAIPALAYLIFYFTEHRSPMKTHCIGAFLCFAFSAIFHGFSCVSANWHKNLAKLDYCGIICHLTLTSLSWVDLVYADSVLGRLFLKFQSIWCAVFVLCVLMSRDFHRGENRGWRAKVFILFIIPSIFPVILVYLRFVKCKHCFHVLMLFGVGSSMLGLILYAFCVPERFLRGRCNFIYSHCCFHVLVMVGSFCFYFYLRALL